MSDDNVLNLAEIPYPSGSIQFRYSRILSPDKTRWIRHGLFVRYSETGQIVSEGNYVLGQEQGLWRDFHSNGQLAAEGEYVEGKEHGHWRFWDEEGNEQPSVLYAHGNEQA